MLKSELVILGLGSNLGNRKENLDQALSQIQNIIGNIKLQSSIYESEAWPSLEQSPYLNMVIQVQTALFPLQILNLLQNIETNIGRKRNIKWESRIIDIDILFYQNFFFKTPELSIPHPFIIKRKFVLKPLAEILPNFIHPLINTPIINLLDNCEDNSWVKKYED